LVGGFFFFFLFLVPAEANQQISEIINEAEKLARLFCEKGWPVMAFIDSHHPDVPEHPYPPHCLAGSQESSLVPGNYCCFLFQFSLC